MAHMTCHPLHDDLLALYQTDKGIMREHLLYQRRDKLTHQHNRKHIHTLILTNSFTLPLSPKEVVTFSIPMSDLK